VGSEMCIRDRNGTGVSLLDADNNTFYGLRLFRASGGSAIGVLLDGGSGSLVTGDNYFYGLAPGAGGLVQQNTADSTVVFGYSRGNGEPAPTVTSGTMSWTEDSKTFGTGWHIGHMASDSRGFKHQRFAMTCSTTTAQLSTCAQTLTWTTPFNDSLYTATCTLDQPNVAGSIGWTAGKTSSTMQVGIVNYSSGVALNAGWINCNAEHP